MKSIYSVTILQRIIDHWGIGLIENVTYFHSLGRNTWRHWIDTNQGVFELYSYPVGEREYAEKKLHSYLLEHCGSSLDRIKRREVVHSFDRYHVLVQFSKKHLISLKQARKELDLLLGKTIEQVFRVYGTILQLHINEVSADSADVLVSNGWKSVQTRTSGETTVIVHTDAQNYEQLDSFLELFEKERPRIRRYVLKANWFELFLSNGHSMHFIGTSEFPTIELQLHGRASRLVVYEEKEIYFTRDLRLE